MCTGYTAILLGINLLNIRKELARRYGLGFCLGPGESINEWTDRIVAGTEWIGFFWLKIPQSRECS